MRFIEFKEALKEFIVFSLSDIHTIDVAFHRRRLNEWQDKGYIKKVIRGYYIFSDTEMNEFVLFTIANKIYSPSYISFESALSLYHFIPESVYEITSANTIQTRTFKTPIACFKYHKIKPELFFDYNLIKYNGHVYKIASPEKALLDYFYINQQINNQNDFAEMRINQETFLTGINREKIKNLAEKIGQKMLKRINAFMEYIKYA